jgi:dihydroneopterin aldolase
VTDRLELRGLRLLGHHGALPGEQDRAQPFEVDLEVEIDTSRAAQTDLLSDAVDYGALCARIASVVTDERYHLLEKIAAVIADRVCEFPGVLGVAVSVRKLRPPVPFDLATAAVRIERRRTE